MTTTPQTPDTSKTFETTPSRWRLVAATTAAAVAVTALGTFALVSGTNAPEAIAAPTETTTTIVQTPTDTTPDDAEVDTPAPPVPADEEVVPEEEPEPEPVLLPGKLSVPESVELDDNNETVIEIHNAGDLDMQMTFIGSDFNDVNFYGFIGIVEGGQTEDLGVVVDDSILPYGAYTIYVTIESDSGSEVVEVNGFKGPVFEVINHDIEVLTTEVVVAHGMPFAVISVFNNEDYDVSVEITEDEVRINNPGPMVLVPGANMLLIPITPWAVHQWHVMVLEIELSWLLGSEIVTITKIGV